MNDLIFYRNLKITLENTFNTYTATYEEVCKRLKQLEDEQEQIMLENWNGLCNVIEATARNYEKANKNYVDITIDIEGNSTIVITNNCI